MKRLLLFTILLCNTIILLGQDSPCECGDVQDCGASGITFTDEATAVAAINAEDPTMIAASNTCYDLSTHNIPADSTGAVYQFCYDYVHSGGAFAFETQLAVPDVASCIPNSSLTKNIYESTDCGTALVGTGSSTDDGWPIYDLSAATYKICTTVDLDESECCGIIEGICTYVHPVCPEITASGLDLTASTTSDCTLSSNLFISEYIEGSSFNKCLEIYNGTGGDIDLAAGGYSIQVFTNGSAGPSNTWSLTGTVVAGDVHVVCSAGAIAAFDIEEDQSFPDNQFYSGDDAVVLMQGTDTLDIIGQVGCDPGANWSGGAFTTKEFTLVRDPSVIDGITTNTASSCGFPALASQWTALPQNTSTELGSHVTDCNVCEGEDFNLNVHAGLNLPTGGTIDWYYNSTPVFDPFNGEGTLLVMSSAIVNGTFPITSTASFSDIALCNTTVYIIGIVNPTTPTSCEPLAQTPVYPLAISCPLPTITEMDMSGLVNNDSIICSGAAATITVAPEFDSYLWSELAATTQDITVSPTATETYTVTVTNSSGCTASAEVEIIVNDPSTGTEDYTGCQGDGHEVIVNGVTYNEGNPTGMETLQNALLCDSVVTINLVYNAPSTGSEDYTGCQGDGHEVIVNGVTYNEGNPTGMETLQNALLCDSVVTINLVYNAPSTGSEDYTGCQGDGHEVIVNGVTYNEGNPTGMETLQNALLCDSVVTINLVYNAPSTGSEDYTGCQGDGHEVIVNGVTYNEGNPTGMETLQNALLCDSVVTINLVYNAPSTGSEDYTGCQGDGHEVIVNGVTYNEGNPTGMETLQNALLCDSVVTINLVYNAPSTGTEDYTGCQGDGHEVIVNGVTYNEGNPTGMETLQNALLCDSVVTINLVYNAPSTGTEDYTGCQGDGHEVIVNGVTYNEGNPTGMETLQNALLCDSVVTINLVYNAPSTGSEDYTGCQGDGHEVIVNGVTYNEGNPTGMETLQNALLCDSVVTINLVYNAPSTGTEDYTGCQGDGHEVIVNGVTYNEGNPTGMETLQNALLCDSVVTINLVYNAPSTGSEDYTGCQGDGHEVIVNGVTYNEGNPTGMETLQNALLCDSVVTINLVYNAPSTGSEDYTGCQGDGHEVIVNGVTYNEGNPTGMETLQNALLCDSVVTINLVYNAPSTGTEDYTGCQGDGHEVIVNGVTYNEGNPTGMETLQNALLCDSVVTINLVYNAPSTGTEDYTGCQGDGHEVIVNGVTYNEGNPTGMETLQNALLCDSVVTINLVYNAPSTGTEDYTGCQGDGHEVIVNGVTYNEGNPTGMETLQNALLCDSVVTINLVYNAPSTGSEDYTGCQGDGHEVIVNGVTYNEGNPTGMETLQNALLCDSVVTINLVYNAPSTGSEDYTGCQGDGHEVIVNGVTYNEGNPTGMETLQNALLCDSVVTINLVYNAPSTGTEDYTGCQGDGHEVIVNGVTYNEGNPTGMETLQNALLCDSVVTINLVYNAPSTGSEDYTGCQGDGHEVIVNGVTYNEGNPTGMETLQNALLCDSVVTINLVYNAPSTGTEDYTGCQGDGHEVIVNGVTYNEGNPTGMETLQNALLCDSVVTINLVYNAPSTGTEDYTGCQGDGHEVIVNGVTYNEGNPTGMETLQNALLCDSVVTINLVYNAPSTGSEDYTGCQGDGHEVIVNGVTYNEGNPTGMETLQNALLCDSVVTINLVYNAPSTGSEDYTGCQGDGHEVIVNGVTYNEGNPTGMETLQNALLCDSVVTINLVYNAPSTGTEDYTGCQGDGHEVIVNGVTYNEGNPTGMETLQNALLCDSVVTINLVYNAPSTGTEDYTGCQGDGHEVIVNGVTYNEGNPTGMETLQNALLCDSVVTINLVYNAPSTGTEDYTGCQGDGHEVIVNGVTYNEGNPTGMETLQNALLCDSVVTINLVYNAPSTGTEDYTGCQGDGHEVIVNGVTYNEGNPTGMETLTNALNCDSVVSINLIFNTLPTASISGALNYCEGSSTTLMAALSPGYTYQWSGTGAVGNELVVATPGDYTVTVTDGNNCTSTDMVTVNELALPIITVAADVTTACEDDVITFTFTGTPGASFTYDDGTTASTEILDGTTGEFTLMITAVTTDVVVTLQSITDGTCSDLLTESETVIVTPLSDAGLDGTLTVCAGGDTNTSVNLPTGLLGTPEAGGSWADDNGAGVDLTDPTTVDFTSIAAGDYNFTYTVSGTTPCPNATAVVTVTVEDEPTITVNGTTCSADLTTFDIDLTIPSGMVSTDFGTIVDNGAGSYSVTGVTTGQTVTIITTEGTCTASTTVDETCPCPPLNDPISDGNETMCEGGTIPTLSVTVDAGLSANWYDAVIGGTILANGTETTTYTPIAPAIGTNSYFAEVIDPISNCTGERVEVILTVNPNPTAETATLNECDDATDDGFTTFTLTDADATVLNGQVGMTVTYHAQLTEANDVTGGMNPLPTSYMNILADMQTIFVRVEDANGCFITNTVNLIVDDLPTFDLDITENSGALINNDEICIGDDATITVSTAGLMYAWSDGVSTTQAITVTPLVTTDYTVVVTDGTGCTASETVTVTVNPLPVATINITETSGSVDNDGVICEGDNATLTVAEGSLQYLWSDGTTGQSITITPLVTTDYTVQVTDIAGCLSTTMTTVIVNTPSAGTEDYVGCVGDGYEVLVNGTAYNEGNPTGTEVIANGNAVDCDSTVTINLVFNATSIGTEDYVGCQGDGYEVMVNGTTYNETNPTGTEVILLGNALACDSTVTINLVYNAPSTGTEDYTGCIGDGYEVLVNGTAYNEGNPTGTEIIANGNALGCDSTVTVTLVFNPESTGMETYVGQQGDGYEVLVNGTAYNEGNPSGTEIITNGNVLGCDSTVTINLIFNPEGTGTEIYTGCEGDGYEVLVNGTAYNEGNPTGVEIITGGTVLGTDSTVTIDLTFNAPSFGTEDYVGCQGDGYEVIVNGTAYNETNPTGTEVILLGNALGCDSTVTINLVYNAASAGTEDYVGCQGDGYEVIVNGTAYNETNPTGTEVILLGNALGCDSTVTINLVYNAASAGMETYSGQIGDGYEVIVNGTAYNETNPTGTEVILLGNALACDSTVTINLVFNAAGTGTEDYVGCQGDGYEVIVNGTAYNETNPTGIEVIANGTILGTDSTVTINLVYNAPSAGMETYSGQIGDGYEVIVNGTAYNETNPTGTEVILLGNALACDSTVTINLVFNAAGTGTEDYVGCQGDGYEVIVNGTAYNETNPTGTEVIANGTVLGTDSTVVITLVYNAASAGNEDYVGCQGDGYEVIVNGTAYNETNPTGTEVILLGNALGCDSTVTINLVYNAASAGNEDYVGCQGDGYEVIVNGTAYNETNPTGTEVILLGNALACDSTVTINLVYNAASAGTEDYVGCQGDGYEVIVNGTAYNETNPTGTEVILLGNALGCDSTVTINLVYNAPSAGMETYSGQIGDGYEVIVNGTAYNETNPTGTEVILLGNALACDSTVTINLVFNAAGTGTEDYVGCQGDGYEVIVNGTAYNETNPTGTEVIANGTVLGTDSTVVITLVYNAASAGTEDYVGCQGDGYEVIVNGTAYNETNPTGTEVILLGNALGCDSTVTINLVYNAASAGNEDYVGCQGDGYEVIVNGTAYNETNPTGTEVILLGNALGCDSTVTINLVYNAASAGNEDYVGCQGDGYEVIVNGTAYNETNPTGTEVILLGNALGCDSTVTINLVYNAASAGNEDYVGCQGDGYEVIVNGTAYNETNPTGTEVILLGNALGCDSTVTINLVYNAASAGTEDYVGCQGDGYEVIVNGTAYNETNPTGTEVILLGNALGCDSTVTINLVYNAASAGNEDYVGCQGDGYEVIVNGTAYNETNPTGTEVILLGNALGCDSTVTINLVYNAASAGNEDYVGCQGDGYEVIVNGTAYNETNPTGTEVILLGNALGCDSTVTINLVYNAASAGNEDYVGCQGDGYEVIVNGTAYNEGNPTGIELIPNGNALGCDSTVTITLVFNSGSVGTETYSGCSGDGYNVVVNGNIYNELAPTGTETLVNALGCDSTVTINLTFNPTSTGTETYSGCSGDGYNVAVNGTLYNEINPVGTEVLPNSFGCDSVVTINLTFLPSPIPVVTGITDICEDGETLLTVTQAFASYAWSNGLGAGQSANITAPDTYFVTVTAANGCTGVSDPIVVTNNSVDVNAIVTSDFDGFGVACSGGANGTATVEVLSGVASFDYLWSNGDTTADAQGLEANTTYTVTVTDFLGCSGTSTVTLTAPGPLTVVAYAIPETCFETYDGQIVVDTVYGGIGDTITDYTFSIDGPDYFQEDTIFSFLESGSYTVTAMDSLGCTTEFDVELIAPQEPFLDLGPDIQIDLGDSIQIISATNVSPDSILLWDPVTDLSCTDCLVPWASPEDDIIYTLTVMDTMGCTATDDILIEVIKNRDVYIPNAFTPDGSGYNDLFTVYGSGQVDRVIEMRIYDRWGELVYSETNFPVNEPGYGWDGRLNGKPMNPAVFVYYTRVRFIDGTVEEFKGDVTLVR